MANTLALQTTCYAEADRDVMNKELASMGARKIVIEGGAEFWRVERDWDVVACKVVKGE